MDLWIRSQDKEMLTKIDYVYLETSNGKEILGGNHYMINKHLGTYKTKERALEVLNEIQNALLNRWANNVNYEIHYDDERPRTLVYEMPID